MASLWCLYQQVWTGFTQCSSASIVEFTQVFANWFNCIISTSFSFGFFRVLLKDKIFEIFVYFQYVLHYVLYNQKIALEQDRKILEYNSMLRNWKQKQLEGLILAKNDSGYRFWVWECSIFWTFLIDKNSRKWNF